MRPREPGGRPLTVIRAEPFTRGPLAYLLRNRFYIGEVVFKGEVFPGERQPFSIVISSMRCKRSSVMNNHTLARGKSESPLIGRIYDDRSNRMSPSHARKQGIRYRYYVSSPLLQGRAGHAGSVRRVPAAEVEALVGQAVREHLKDLALPDGDLIRAHVARVDVQADHLVIELRRQKRNRLPAGKMGGRQVAIAASRRPTALSISPHPLRNAAYPAARRQASCTSAVSLRPGADLDQSEKPRQPDDDVGVGAMTMR